MSLKTQSTLLNAPGSGASSSVLPWVSVKATAYGAKGDGSTDDTAAVAAAYSAANAAGVPLYLPAGTYKVTSWPTMADHTAVVGDGSDLTTVLYTGSGYLVTLTGKQRIRFHNLGFWTTGATGGAVKVDNSFRCSFESVVFRGSHASANYPTYTGQTGIYLTGNSGGTVFLNCDINNFGTGLKTDCIQNYVNSSKFATNYIGVLGTGNTGAAGLSIVNCEFVGVANTNDCSKHVYIDGAANDWWITNTWFEGVDTCLDIGVAGTGGPSQFGIVNCKAAAKTAVFKLNHCRQAYLANVRFDVDTGDTPTELTINSTYCVEGTAANLISAQNYEIALSSYPASWTVFSRGKTMLPAVKANVGNVPLVVQSPTGQTVDTADFFGKDGTKRTWVDSDGSLKVGGQGTGNDARFEVMYDAGQTRIIPSGLSASGFNANPFSDDYALSVAPRSTSSKGVVIRALTSQTADIARFEVQGGTAPTAMLAGGTMLSDDAAKGLILKDSAGHYWRVTVSTSGVPTTTDLGTIRPTS